MWTSHAGSGTFSASFRRVRCNVPIVTKIRGDSSSVRLESCIWIMSPVSPVARGMNSPTTGILSLRDVSKNLTGQR
jgi:hypothetical protein